MKIKVNRNNLWAKIFIDQLTQLGVQYACTSPGSRSTPLTYTLSKSRKIKSYVHIDERSSAFFALGLAKLTDRPVIIVTTSGTAVAELYPAIIEAFFQRIPLIICTADRPAELIGRGANQTINQHNIFKNHIKWFRDLGLPSISETGLRHLQKLAIKSYQISLFEDKGPVHLNFPFRKPLEPFSFTDEISSRILKISPLRQLKLKSNSSTLSFKTSEKLITELIKCERGIILVGPMEYNRELINKIKKLSSLLKYPVVADGLSQLRFRITKSDKTIFTNFNAALNSDDFVQKYDPELILQFGRTPTSSEIENFLKKSNADRYVINKYGDIFDPSGNSKAILAIEPKTFCENLMLQLKSNKFVRSKSEWLKDFIKTEEICNYLKNRVIENSKYLNEPSIITEIFKCLPSGSNVFIGNSLPVRDMDNFLCNTAKSFNIHFNRGASGIDGVTSTALGIAAIDKPTFLITGDLSFLHDLNALIIARKYLIPITILLINNNGGGIFQSFPIAQEVNKFEEYFISPHNLNLSGIVKSFGINYKLISNKAKLRQHLKNSLKKNLTTILEIQTDAIKSVELRNKYFYEIKKKLNKEFQK